MVGGAMCRYGVGVMGGGLDPLMLFSDLKGEQRI
jgi:hypothetical protein